MNLTDIRTACRDIYRMLGNGIGRDAGSISNLCAQDEAGAVHSVGDSGNCTR